MTASDVEICSQKPTRLPKRNSLTVSAPRGSGGYVGGVAGVRPDPGDQGLHPVVGRGGAGGHAPGPGPAPAGRGAAAGCNGARSAADSARPTRLLSQLGRARRADLGLDGVDGALAQPDGRDDGAVVGAEEVDPAGNHTSWALSAWKTRSGPEAGRCRRSAGQTAPSTLSPRGRAGRRAIRRRCARGTGPRRRPALPVPAIEGLADPVRRTLGAHPHHHASGPASRAGRCRGCWRSRDSHRPGSGRSGFRAGTARRSCRHHRRGRREPGWRRRCPAGTGS